MCHTCTTMAYHHCPMNFTSVHHSKYYIIIQDIFLHVVDAYMVAYNNDISRRSSYSQLCTLAIPTLNCLISFSCKLIPKVTTQYLYVNSILCKYSGNNDFVYIKEMYLATLFCQKIKIRFQHLHLKKQFIYIQQVSKCVQMYILQFSQSPSLSLLKSSLFNEILLITTTIIIILCRTVFMCHCSLLHTYFDTVYLQHPYLLDKYMLNSN